MRRGFLPPAAGAGAGAGAAVAGLSAADAGRAPTKARVSARTENVAINLRRTGFTGTSLWMCRPAPGCLSFESEEAGIPIDLPLAHRLVVLLPLGSFVADELSCQFGAQHRFDERALLEGVDGL